MSRRIRLCISVCAFIATGLAVLPGTASAANEVVGTKSASCPNAQFPTIQGAVNAAPPGSTIRICEGVYPEQVTINKALTLAGDSGAEIQPTSMTANTTDPSSGDGIAAIVLVEDTTDVNIHGLIVDGSMSGLSGCGPDFIGVFYRNASGELRRVAVREVELAPSLNGCQSGSGILVESGSGELSTVDIEDSSVHDYQKNGITANETGTSVTIVHNVVTGVGPTTGASQNGIQVAFGAGGSISRNTIANNIWSPCVSLTNCSDVATDILVDGSDNVTVENNKAGISQIAIAIVANHAHVNNNVVFDSQIADGIDLVGNDSDGTNNQITNSSRAGVFVQGNSNDVESNTIDEAAVGVLEGSGSTGNVVANNTIFNAGVKVQDPSTAPLKVSPYR